MTYIHQQCHLSLNNLLIGIIRKICKLFFLSSHSYWRICILNIVFNFLLLSTTAINKYALYFLEIVRYWLDWTVIKITVKGPRHGGLVLNISVHNFLVQIPVHRRPAKFWFSLTLMHLMGRQVVQGCVRSNRIVSVNRSSDRFFCWWERNKATANLQSSFSEWSTRSAIAFSSLRRPGRITRFSHTNSSVNLS